jgi:tRNA-specific 2-thiouridylase
MIRSETKPGVRGAGRVRALDAGDAIQVQICHRAPAAAATVESVAAGSVALRFEAPQRAVSPGQNAVMFDDDRVLGGGRTE